MSDLSLARRAGTEPEFFARVLLGHELWAHQVDVARSVARYRVICAGRQVGKSRLLAVLALWEAFRGADRMVLIVSAGESAAKRLLDECAALAASSPLLRGSVLEETTAVLTLANGSQIRAVPASAAQIRGWAVDVLIVDEAGFIDPRIWQSAEPAIIARPGSRVILSSTPWGGPQHFFRQLWRRGMTAPDEQVASWHWPSSISPQVDAVLLEEIRKRESPIYFAREFLAEWTEGAGAYFTTDEVERNVADYELIDPGRAWGQVVCGGVDWGLSFDANVLVLLGVLADGELNVGRHPRDAVFFIAWLEAHHRMPYSTFIDRVVDVADPEQGGFHVRTLASETNGVGQMPTEQLSSRAYERRIGMFVSPVVTDARRKQSMFGGLKMLLQQGRLLLPRHPELLKQLAALEFEISNSGSMRISVAERNGHDDIAMALGQAASCLKVGWPGRAQALAEGDGEVLTTDMGTRIFTRPRCLDSTNYFVRPRGGEAGDGW